MQNNLKLVIPFLHMTDSHLFLLFNIVICYLLPFRDTYALHFKNPVCILK